MEQQSKALAPISSVETAAERTAAGVHEAFASVFDAASERVMDAVDDPYDFDERLHADNLAGAAGDVRRAFEWL